MAEGQRSAGVEIEAQLATRERRRAWAWVAAWTLVVFVLSEPPFSAENTGSLFVALMHVLGVPSDLIDPLHFFTRKGAHVSEYAVLGGLAFRALRFSRPALPAAGLALALSLAVAGADELNQSTEASRTGSSRDVAIDLSGAALGVLLRQRWQALRTPSLR